MYGNLHGTYKKALQKALQKKLRLLRLIEILEEFTNLASSEDEDDSNEGLDENSENSDKENTDVFQLQNPKVRCGKGRSAGIKRYKALHEKDKITKKQRHCLICGNLGHYQKNCKGKVQYRLSIGLCCKMRLFQQIKKFLNGKYAVIDLRC